MLRFEVWLVEQQTRKDFIGEFACFWGAQNIFSTFSKRKLDEHKLWADLVCRIAQPGQIAAFNEAWQEFLLARETSQDNH